MNIPGCGIASLEARPGSRTFSGTIHMNGEARSIEVSLPARGAAGSYRIHAQYDEIYGMPIARVEVCGSFHADDASLAALSDTIPGAAPAAGEELDSDASGYA